MSLVNDLLIELDRRKAEKTPARSALLDGLEPTDRPRRSGRRLGTGVALIATTAFIGAGLHFVLAAGTPPIAGRGAVGAAPAPLVDLVDLVAPPKPPGARLPLGPPAASASEATNASPTVGDRAPASERAATIHRIDRAPRLSALALEPRAHFTRLRLAGDAGLRAVVDRSVSGRRLVLHLPKAQVAAPFDGLDLGRTPVVSLTTREIDDGLSFELELDRPVRVRTQEQRTADATTILVDLTPVAPSPPERAREVAGAGRTHADTRHAPAAVERPVAATRRDRAAAPRSGGIERSASDRARAERERARARADDALALARLAREDGRLEEALAHAVQASTQLPDHREALLEHVALLSELGRADEAIERVRSARRERRRDAGLAMLHARLLEASGRRDQAIRTIDESGLDVASAPELHALAAVFLQRDADHAEAIDRFEAIVRRHPGEARWWMGLGISLEAQARTSEAADVYRIAIELGALSRPSREWVGARIAALEGEEG